MEFQYFHGNITKEKCEELLSKVGINGSFLLRDSESVPGALCLCVFYEHLIYTYRIFRKSNGHFMMQTSEGTPRYVFRTLKDLIDNYKKPNQGLVIHLCYPVNRCPYYQETQTVYVTKKEAYENPDDAEDYINVLPD
ncbi:SH2 domain-containing protein 1B [Protobothrops mucrosquamatus]|uniref:SH2 domain-containing protein 1B n=1 Tax=Protobothrops mucrosquamatus TaxID=103944 RepID=UPI0007758AC1|nr:SH2 domain-containing protein 1B [Protobothrops mucrosquamatus]